jgi:hypothetical protein
MSNPIYIVSGFYRSGTSAMMQALMAGGLTGAWSEARNAVAAQHADEHYHPNRAGLFEIPLREYRQPGFPLQYEGKLIKVLLWGLHNLAPHPGGYRIIIMRRDPEEIRQSYEGFFLGRKCPPLVGYAERIARAAKMLVTRPDALSVSIVDYAYAVAHPARAMIRLRGDGWPIDPLEAADVIDPAQYRFRKELLTVGI